MKNKTVIVIQARMGSSRLRGKSLMPVLGKPLLLRVIETGRLLGFCDEIIVATTELQEDDPIESFTKLHNEKVYRGSPLNLLERFIMATSHLKETDNIVRLTADNPLNWVEISEKLFMFHEEQNNDYTCIDGLSHIVCEVIRVGALRSVNKEEDLTTFDLEHVTPYFRKNSNKYKVVQLPADYNGLRPDLDHLLTIDTIDDLIRFENIGRKINLDNIIDFYKVYPLLEQRTQGLMNGKFGEIKVILNGVPVGDKYPTYIIAEIGQNHNGDITIAKKLIEMAARCGVNAVKFQKRDIACDLTSEMFNMPYDNPNSFGKTYGEHRIYLELDERQHRELKEFANACGLTYFCTPCDIPSTELLESINVPFYKIASRDLTNIPLLRKIKSTGKPVIISTGMADYDDIEDAISVLNLPKEKLIIMQCTSEYPCKPENVNLSAIARLREKYGYLVGLSDHTSGVIISSAASALGAKIIEKHVTLDRTMKGTDHPGSLEEQGLKKLVEYIRAIELAMGNGEKKINSAVENSRNKLGRSLTTIRTIKRGEVISEDLLCLKSPGTGIIWRDRHKILGKIAKKDIDADSTIKPEDLE